MKPIVSPLSILDFAITAFTFELVPGEENDGKAPIEYFEDYDLDIDFDMFKSDIIHVKISAEVNKQRKYPGYSLTATATCFFEFEDNKEITTEQKNSVEGFSTLYIALNSLRGLISTFTSNAPLGRYILPSIDLNDLIEQKKNSIRSEESVVNK